MAVNALAIPSGGKTSLAAPILIASFVVSYWVFWYAFTSVWCFFAAVLAVLLCYVFYYLPASTEVTSAKNWHEIDEKSKMIETAP